MDEPRLWIAVILRQLCSWIPNPVCSLRINFPQNACLHCLLSLRFCLLWHRGLNVGPNSSPGCSSLISISCPRMWRQSEGVGSPMGFFLLVLYCGGEWKRDLNYESFQCLPPVGICPAALAWHFRLSVCFGFDVQCHAWSTVEVQSLLDYVHMELASVSFCSSYNMGK